MLKSLFGPDSLTHMLRGGLEEASATHRAIAARVAGAVEASTSGDFAGQLEAHGRAQSSEADLQQDMTALADTELPVAA